MAVLLLPALLGCNVVQGFQDAGDTLFPEQSTHLSTPALRLVSGGYRSLALAAGRELSVLARSTESDTSLFVMRFANPRPCEIPEVGRYVASRNPNRAEAGIAYFRDDAAQGTLHFADTSCRTFDLELEDARLPVGETDTTIIVWAAGDLLEVAPEKGERTKLATGVTNVVTRAFSGRTLVLTEGRLEVFDGDWKSQGRFGENVSGLLKTTSGALYLDSTGVRRLSAGADNRTTLDELIEPDACNLALRGDWATFHAPCAEQRLVALHEPTGNLYPLPFQADPYNIRIVPARGSVGTDLTQEPYWFLFLRNTTDSGGTLVLRDPKGEERILGESAVLTYSDFDASASPAFGHALVNVVDRAGDYVYFDAEGQQRTLAHGVFTRGDRLLADWNGATGSLVVVSGDRLEVVAQGVPSSGFEFKDSSNAWTVLFHDWEGDRGRLSRFSGSLDALYGTPPDAPFAAPVLQEVAPSVGPFTTVALGALLPGTSFLADYDPETATGRLTYENVELRFQAVVDSGVSDYLVTADYLMYTIPYGRDRGIWLATGK
ncbi:MAG: hypothetical protein EOO73_19375 [Myxococcales bacterium]|nr:MAG: hypothetical protein EOO73_19375 [Myxococcales bacterium]